ncbi:hypothetical protein ACRRTK_017315 [Alexandromys fortis]
MLMFQSHGRPTTKFWRWGATLTRLASNFIRSVAEVDLMTFELLMTLLPCPSAGNAGGEPR